MATNEGFFRSQFEKCSIYAPSGQMSSVRYINGQYSMKAELTNSQLDEIITHITSFLDGKKTSFHFEMNGVMLNGKIQDNVSIFGETAVSHMDDVKPLFDLVKIASFIALAVMLICILYLFKRKSHTKSIVFKYSLYAILGIVAAALLFLLGVYLKMKISGESDFFSALWTDMHHIFFPFSASKFGGSFFNDTLTMLLTLDFFMNCVKTIVLCILASLSVWLGIALVLGKTK